MISSYKPKSSNKILAEISTLERLIGLLSSREGGLPPKNQPKESKSLDLINFINSTIESDKNQGLRAEHSKQKTRLGSEIFKTIAPYLIKQRIKELSNWLDSCLAEEECHPILTISSIYALLLQTAPLESKNIELIHKFISKCLEQISYPNDLISIFLKTIDQEERSYIAALRESEKSFFQDWSSFEVWHLFFCKQLKLSAEALFLKKRSNLLEKRLSKGQKEILSAVKKLGLCSRAEIEKESGVNLNTIKYHLGKMVKEGYLKKTGNAKNTRYSPS